MGAITGILGGALGGAINGAFGGGATGGGIPSNQGVTDASNAYLQQSMDNQISQYQTQTAMDKMHTEAANVSSVRDTLAQIQKMFSDTTNGINKAEDSNLSQGAQEISQA